MSRPSDKDRPDTIRDHLTDWPYVPRYLQQSLDHELIARHGEAILRRALNTGRVVCFVGSGVSMSYGRLGWGDMVRRLLDRDRDPLKTARENPLAARLGATLDQIDLKNLPSARYPAIFQLGEELAKASLDPAKDAENKFRTRARELLFDDQGHAYVLYQDLREDLQQLTRSKAESRDDPFPLPDCAGLTREGILGSDAAPRAGQSPWAAYFMVSGEDLALWRGQLDETFTADGIRHRACQLMDALRTTYPVNPPQVRADTAVHLRPLHRFVLPALLRLTAHLDDLFPVVADRKRQGRPRAAHPRRRVFEHRLDKWSTSVRSEVTPPGLDPLTLLADGLSISRYITTNYDVDLERLMRDRGFVIDRRRREANTADGGEASATTSPSDALGAGARDTVFHADRALELVEFSVHNPDHALSVVHLHGRATQGDDMIVTERDYLDRYLRRGDEADLVNTAISLAFGANPLLFVGSGMSEDDILRPLRQFLAERKSKADRRAVVLLPADSAQSRQIEETIAHYNRYGVFTVHYGYAELDGPAQASMTGQDREDERDLVRNPTEKPSSQPGKLRWLALAKAMCSDLSTCVQEMVKWLQAQAEADATGTGARPTKPPPPGRELVDAVRKMEGMRPNDGPDNATGAKQWLAALVRVDGNKVEMAPLRRLDGVLLSKAPALEPKLESLLLQWTLQVVIDAVEEFFNLPLPTRWASPSMTSGIVEPTKRRRSERETTEWLRLLMCARAVLAGLPNALIALCLSAKLTEIKESWLTWKTRAEELPMARPNGGPRWLVPAYSGQRAAMNAWLKADAPVLSRHPVALRSREGDGPAVGALVPPGDRFLGNSPSHTFRVFCRSLRAARDKPGSLLSRGTLEAGRRVFVLLAPRGVGKGHFFEMLSRPERLADFASSSWREGHAQPYGAFALFNLSFSHEVVSVFDRLANLLVERAHVVFEPGPAGEPGPAEQIWNANIRLRQNRIGRLTRILALYDEHYQSAVARVFVALNGFNFLFDDRGFPKNAQLHRLVMALLGAGAGRAPLDLVLVCTDQNLPRLFAPRRAMPDLRSPIVDGWSTAEPFVMEHLTCPEDGDKRRREVDSLVRRLGVELKVSDEAPPATVASSPPGTFFFHILRGARASTTIAKYFPEVALAIAAHPGEIGNAHPGKEDFRQHWIDHLEIPPRKDLENLQGAIFHGAMSDDTNARRVVLGLPGTLRRIVEASRHRQGRLNLRQPFLGEEGAKGAFDDLIDEDFSHLFRELGRNRFLLTIVCAAASEAARGELSADNDRTMRVADVTGWIRRSLARQLGDSPGQREDAIIASVLTFYRQRHEARAPLSLRTEIEKALDPDRLPLEDDLPQRFAPKAKRIVRLVADALKGPLGWSLQQHVLWHLAVVGHPIEADVLAEAPKIQAACSRSCVSSPAFSLAGRTSPPKMKGAGSSAS